MPEGLGDDVTSELDSTDPVSKVEDSLEETYEVVMECHVEETAEDEFLEEELVEETIFEDSNDLVGKVEDFPEVMEEVKE